MTPTDATRSPRDLPDDTAGALAVLAVPAPAHVADDVLVEVGLADRMASGASVVGIASIEAHTVLATTGATSPIYASTKAALRSMTETLAVELGPRGIRVNAVAPGLIRTRLTERAQADKDAWVRGSTPLRRWGEPEDIADAVAFLASPAAGFITGVTLDVDGGLTLGLVYRGA